MILVTAPNLPVKLYLDCQVKLHFASAQANDHDIRVTDPGPRQDAGRRNGENLNFNLS